MIVIRPINNNEPDHLTGRENLTFILTDLDGKELLRIEPPHDGWSHDTLEAIDCHALSPYGWDAYLGVVNSENWIGCSEV